MQQAGFKRAMRRRLDLALTLTVTASSLSYGFAIEFAICQLSGRFKFTETLSWHRGVNDNCRFHLQDLNGRSVQLDWLAERPSE